jgi:ABC-2 type transport system ATP-binding protein
MIEVHGLRRTFGAITAVDGIEFNVGKGEIFGLLGPNGAGKSTTIAMMAGLIKPDEGWVRIDEAGTPEDPEVRRRIGLVPQTLALYEDLSAEENLRFCARLFGLDGKRLSERIGWALELAGLGDRCRDRVGKFSGGMKRRLNLACGLVHDPKVAFLDEPTVGVDPQSRNFIFEAIERLREQGLTVVYTTHYMEEVERLCDRVAIIDQGRILALDSVDNLIDRYGGVSVIVAELKKMPDGFAFEGAQVTDTQIRLSSQAPFEDVARLAGMSLPMKSLRIERPDMESVFLALTGRSLRDQ